MNNSYLKRLWLVVKIWLFAVAANGILGTLYLSNFFKSSYAGEYLQMGFAWGATFSFPIMIALLVVLRHCIDSNKTGRSIFLTMLSTGIGLTVLMFLVFCALTGGGGASLLGSLLCISIVSGVVGITTQYKSLLKLGSDFKSRPSWKPFYRR